jgi:hypothetical protein
MRILVYSGRTSESRLAEELSLWLELLVVVAVEEELDTMSLVILSSFEAILSQG